MKPENKRILRAARALREARRTSGGWTVYRDVAEKELGDAVDAAKREASASGGPAACLSPAQRDALGQISYLLHSAMQWGLEEEPNRRVQEAYEVVQRLLRETETAAQGVKE